MSTFRYCTGQRLASRWVVHLHSNLQKQGELCSGSFITGDGFRMCTGTIVVPDDDMQLAMHAAWKLGGRYAVIEMLETDAKFVVQR